MPIAALQPRAIVAQRGATLELESAPLLESARSRNAPPGLVGTPRRLPFVGALDVRCSSVRAARNASSCTRRPHTSLSSVSQHQALLPGCLLIQSSVDVSICNQYCWSSGTSRNGSGLRHRRISSCGVARCSTSPAQTLEKTSQPFRRAPSSAAPAQSVGLLALLISPGTMPHRRSQASSICPCHPAGTPGPFLRKRGSSCLFSGVRLAAARH